MNTIVLAVDFLALLAIVGLCLLGRFYLPGYLAKKGENLATKEDVAKITALTEEIRAKVANLEWFRQEEIKALLDFYDASSRFLLGPLNRNWRTYAMSAAPEAIVAQVQETDSAIQHVNLLLYRLMFYGADNLSLVAAGDLANSCIRAGEIFHRHLAPIATARKKVQRVFASTQADEVGREERANALMSMHQRISAMFEELTPEQEEAHISFGAFLQSVHRLLEHRGIEIRPASLRVLMGTPPRPATEAAPETTSPEEE